MLKECNRYELETKDDTDFFRFRSIHPDVSKPSPVWILAREYPHMLEKCFNVAKIIAQPYVTLDNLCEHCGFMYSDKLSHFVCICSYTLAQRNQFWDIIHNTFPIDLSSYLYNIEDDDAFVNIILGGPCTFLQDFKTHLLFMSVTVNFISKIMDCVNLL